MTVWEIHLLQRVTCVFRNVLHFILPFFYFTLVVISVPRRHPEPTGSNVQHASALARKLSSPKESLRAFEKTKKNLGSTAYNYNYFYNYAFRVRKCDFTLYASPENPSDIDFDVELKRQRR